MLVPPPKRIDLGIGGVGKSTSHTVDTTHWPLRIRATSDVRKYTRRPSFSFVALIVLVHSQSVLKLMRKPSDERSRIFASCTRLSKGPYCSLSTSSIFIRKCSFGHGECIKDAFRL